MPRFLVFVTALLFSMFANAQSTFLSSSSDAKKAAEGVVASIAAGNYPGAWKELKPLSVLPQAEIEAFEAQFNSQVENLLRRFGSSSGYELYREEALGSSLVRYQFLVRHEKAPLRWMFVFYRAEKGWVLTDFKFDGNATTFFAGGA